MKKTKERIIAEVLANQSLRRSGCSILFNAYDHATSSFKARIHEEAREILEALDKHKGKEND